MKVDIIIPNFNGSHLIKNNIPKVVQALEGYDGQIIIVDDGSDEEERKKVREIINGFQEKHKNIIYIEHSVNKGFSSAVNTGVKASRADFVVLLNSDVIPSKDFLKSPLEKLKNDENLFAVGCMDESIERDSTVFRGRGIARWHKGMLIHSKGEIDSQETFWVSGGSSIFKREIYENLNGMDEIYNPFYWEDIDLSYRARKSGYKILFDKNSIVRHLHEEGAIKRNFTNKTVTFTAYRNQFIFLWKNITDTKLLFDHFVLLPINMYGALKRKDNNFFKGFFLAIGKLPAIIRKRQMQKKLYKISDAEIIKNFS